MGALADLGDVLAAEYTLNVLPVVILLLTVACAVLALVCGYSTACGTTWPVRAYWKRAGAVLAAGIVLAWAAEVEFDRRYHP
jgi:hypothetical protein